MVLLFMGEHRTQRNIVHNIFTLIYFIILISHAYTVTCCINGTDMIPNDMTQLTHDTS